MKWPVISRRILLSGYPLAFVVSLAYALWLFPVDFILGGGVHWAAPGGDSLQTVIGIRYFLADGWRFPLFQTRLVAAPDGFNIIYTDSLPLVALITKLLGASAQVNPLGMWYFFIYVMQGVAMMFLLRSLNVRGLLPSLAGTLIALSFPPWLLREGHAALCGHFLVLVALGLYFRIVRQHVFGRLWRWFAILCWLTLIVNPYLFAMVFGIFLAAAAQEGFSSRTVFLNALMAVVAVTGGSALLMWVSGYIQGAGQGAGFGYYSMNLLSPWVPQKSGLFPAMKDIIDGTGGQYEGFNYLGFGVVLLAATGLWVGRSLITLQMRRYWGLMVVLSTLGMLALSNRVFIGQWEFLRIDIDAPLLQTFRSSGRFFWPVGYAIMATSLAAVSLKLRRPWNHALVIAAVVLQVIDAGPFREHVASAARSAWRFDVPAEPWRKLIAAHERLTIVPSFECAGDIKGSVVDLVFHASSSATPTNTMYLARSSQIADCNREVVSLRNQVLGENELLVVLSPPVNALQVSLLPSFEHLCRSFAGGFACSRQWLQSGMQLAGDFSNPKIDASYELGTEIRFSKGGNSSKYITGGWSVQESWGTWTEGPQAELSLGPRDAASSDLTLDALVRGFRAGNTAVQTVNVSVNGHFVGGWRLRYGDDEHVSMTIPRSIAAADSPIHIEFRIAKPTSPSSDGQSGDTRQLGMGVVWLRLDRPKN